MNPIFDFGDRTEIFLYSVTYSTKCILHNFGLILLSSLRGTPFYFIGLIEKKENQEKLIFFNKRKPYLNKSLDFSCMTRSILLHCKPFKTDIFCIFRIFKSDFVTFPNSK